MHITFKRQKLKKVFDSSVALTREYGPKCATLVMRRMSVLKSAPSLASVPTGKPCRCHQLDHNRKDQFAVDVEQPRRLIFEVNHDPIPRLEDGGIDLSLVTDIRILEVKNYHGE